MLYQLVNTYLSIYIKIKTGVNKQPSYQSKKNLTNIKLFYSFIPSCGINFF